MSLSIIKFPVPGSGAAVNAANGIYLSSATVKLGGPLIEFTNIDIDNQFLSFRDDSTQQYLTLIPSAFSGVGLQQDIYSQEGTAFSTIFTVNATQFGATVSDYLGAGAVESRLLITKDQVLVSSKTKIDITAPLISIGDIANADTILVINDATGNHQFTGRVGFGIVPVAQVDIAAGTATAGTAPIKLHSGTLLTTPVVGSIEYLTDKLYLTITSGAARKEFTMNDGVLTSGRIPFATTNGRLLDASDFRFIANTGGGPSFIIGSSSMTGASAATTLSFIQTWNNAALTPTLIGASIIDIASDANFSYFLNLRNITAGVGFQVDKFGTLSAGNPGSGSALWRLGGVINAVSVVNLTRYVEIMINGSVVKLATMT